MHTVFKKIASLVFKKRVLVIIFLISAQALQLAARTHSKLHSFTFNSAIALCELAPYRLPARSTLFYHLCSNQAKFEQIYRTIPASDRVTAFVKEAVAECDPSLTLQVVQKPQRIRHKDPFLQVRLPELLTMGSSTIVLNEAFPHGDPKALSLIEQGPTEKLFPDHTNLVDYYRFLIKQHVYLMKKSTKRNEILCSWLTKAACHYGYKKIAPTLIARSHYFDELSERATSARDIGALLKLYLVQNSLIAVASTFIEQLYARRSTRRAFSYALKHTKNPKQLQNVIRYLKTLELQQLVKKTQRPLIETLWAALPTESLNVAGTSLDNDIEGDLRAARQRLHELKTKESHGT